MSSHFDFQSDAQNCTGRASGLIVDAPSSLAANSGPNSEHRQSLIKACVDAFRSMFITVLKPPFFSLYNG